MKKQKNNKKKSTFSIITKSVVLSIVIGIVIFAGLTVVYSLTNKDGKGMTITDALVNMVTMPKSEILNQEYVTILMTGTNQKLTDSIMVARYCPSTKKVSILSIPRDTYVGKGIDKRINSVYAWKGMDELKSTVEEITNVKIDRYASINTKALRDVVDAVGGVEVDVPVKMDYDDPAQDLHIHLKPGLQTLNGVQAEGFVRMRKCFADQDLSRVKNQRAFLQALAKKVTQPNNLLKVNSIIDIALNNTETDLTIREMLDLLTSVKDMNFDTMTSATLPTYSDRINGRAMERVDTAKAKTVVKETLVTALQADTAGDEEK